MDTLLLLASYIFDSLIRASWIAAIVFPVAWLICQVSSRMPRQIHCWVWRIAYLKVIVATLWVVPISIPVLSPEKPTLPVSGFVAPATISLDESVQVPVASVEFQGADAITPERPRWENVLVMLWLSGVFFCVYRSCQEWSYSCRVRRFGKECESSFVLTLLENAATEMDVSKVPPLVESDDVDGPALVGLMRPIVVIPKGMWNRLRPESMNLVLRHELGHLKRGDLSWNCLPRAIGCLLFFHPAAWFANRRWHMAQESACDELVLLGREASARDYANALLKIATSVPQDRRPRFSTLAAVSSFRVLQERILAMRNVRKWTRSQFGYAWCCMILISSVGLVPWQFVASSNSSAFANGGFESGKLTGWTIQRGHNSIVSYDQVALFDIDASGPGNESQAFLFSVGQDSSESGTYRHVEITQEVFLVAGQMYEIRFDWAVKNSFGFDNFDGGVFELIVDKQMLASYDTENIFSESIETGTLRAEFTALQSGNHSIGARISRKFPISFPARSEPVLLQAVDNFLIFPKQTKAYVTMQRGQPEIQSGTLHVTNEKVNSLFSSMRVGTYRGWRFPDLGFDDIPALLNLAEETRVLSAFPRNPLSSQFEATCREGIVAIWLIEGIRKGNKFPSLNALCLSHPRNSDDWKDATEDAHDQLLDAYRKWWKSAQQLSATDANNLHPLQDMGLHWH